MTTRSAVEDRGTGTGAGRREDWLDLESDLAVHVLTEDGIIAATNRAFDELFGAKRAQLLGKHQAALNNHSVAANLRLLRDIRHEVDTAGSWRGLLTNRHARGTEFTARAHIYPMRCRGLRRLVCFQQPLTVGARRSPARVRQPHALVAQPGCVAQAGCVAQRG